MKSLCIPVLISLFSCIYLSINVIITNDKLDEQTKEIRELQKQYYNLYNSHNYVLKQVEDMKQF